MKAAEAGLHYNYNQLITRPREIAGKLLKNTPCSGHEITKEKCSGKTFVFNKTNRLKGKKILSRCCLPCYGFTYRIKMAR